MSLPIPFKSLSRRGTMLLCVGALGCLSLASYGFTAYDLIAALIRPGISYELADRDFANYWLAGQLIASSAYLDLFTQSLYFPHLQEVFGLQVPTRNWSYPPHYLLLVWPLAYVGYETGFVLFHAFTLLIFLAAVLVARRHFAPRSDLGVLVVAVSSYALMMFVTAQNGFLTAGALLLGLAWMRTRPILGGLAFALLTIKPQLGFLIPLLLVLDRNWRVLFWTSGFTLAIVSLSIACFGLESWRLYLTETVEYQRYVMTDWGGLFLRMMPTVFGAVRSLGYTPEVALTAQAPVTVLAAAMVLWLLIYVRDPLWRAFTVTTGTFLITPYAFNYDMGAVCVCAALLAGRAESAPRDRFSLVIVTVIAALPGVVMNLGRADLPLAPFMLFGGLWVALVTHYIGAKIPPHRLPAPAKRELARRSEVEGQGDP